MWIWAFEQFPELVTERKGQQALNERLPRLECRNNLPMPIDPKDA